MGFPKPTELRCFFKQKRSAIVEVDKPKPFQRPTKLRDTIRKATTKLFLTKATPREPVGFWYQNGAANHDLESPLASSAFSSFEPSLETNYDDSLGYARSADNIPNVNHHCYVENPTATQESFKATGESDYDNFHHTHDAIDYVSDLEYGPVTEDIDRVAFSGLYGNAQDLGIQAEGFRNLASHYLDETDASISATRRVDVADRSDSPEVSPWPVRHVHRRPRVISRQASLTSHSVTSTISTARQANTVFQPSDAAFCTGLITTSYATMSRPFACVLHAAIAAASVLLLVIPEQPVSTYQTAIDKIEIAAGHALNMSVERDLATSPRKSSKANLTVRAKEKSWHTSPNKEASFLQKRDDKIIQLRQISFQGLHLIEKTMQQEHETKQLLEGSRRQTRELGQLLEVSRLQKYEVQQMLGSRDGQVKELQDHIVALQQEVARQIALSRDGQQQVIWCGSTAQEWHAHCMRLTTDIEASKERPKRNRSNCQDLVEGRTAQDWYDYSEDLEKQLVKLHRSLEAVEAKSHKLEFDCFAKDRILDEAQLILEQSKDRHARATDRLADKEAELGRLTILQDKELRSAKDAERKAKNETTRAQSLWQKVKEDNAFLSKQNRNLALQLSNKIPDDELAQLMGEELSKTLDKDDASQDTILELTIRLGATQKQLEKAHDQIVKNALDVKTKDDELTEARKNSHLIEENRDELALEVDFMRSDVDQIQREKRAVERECRRVEETAKLAHLEADKWQRMAIGVVQKPLTRDEYRNIQGVLATKLKTELDASQLALEKMESELQQCKKHAAHNHFQLQVKLKRQELDFEAKIWSVGRHVVDGEQSYYRLQAAEATIEAFCTRFSQELTEEPLVVPDYETKIWNDEHGPEYVTTRDDFFEWLFGGERKVHHGENWVSDLADPRRIKAMFGYGPGGFDPQKEAAHVDKDYSKWSKENERRAADLMKAELELEGRLTAADEKIWLAETIEEVYQAEVTRREAAHTQNAPMFEAGLREVDRQRAAEHGIRAVSDPTEAMVTAEDGASACFAYREEGSAPLQGTTSNDCEEAPDAADIEEQVTAQTLRNRFLNGELVESVIESEDVLDVETPFETEVYHAFATPTDVQKKLRRRDSNQLSITGGGLTERLSAAEFDDNVVSWMNSESSEKEEKVGRH